MSLHFFRSIYLIRTIPTWITLSDNWNTRPTYTERLSNSVKHVAYAQDPKMIAQRLTAMAATHWSFGRKVLVECSRWLTIYHFTTPGTYQTTSSRS